MSEGSSGDFSGESPNVLVLPTQGRLAQFMRFIPKGGPSFRPYAWEKKRIRNNTNCYTYVLDVPEVGWGLPGTLQDENAPEEISDFSVSTLQERVERDGLLPRTPAEAEGLSSKKHHIVVVFAKVADTYLDSDIHCLRRDRDGSWSHKAGEGAPSQYDAFYQRITDPQVAAAQEKCSELVGYYEVPPEGLEYIPRL